MEVSALNNTMCLCRDREPATGALSILQAGYRRHLHYPVQSQRLLSQRLYTGGVLASRGWKKGDERMNRQGRGREGERRGRAGVVASSAFQNMRPYFTDIYCHRNVFFGRGNLCVRRNGCIRLWQQHALTHKHYLVSV